MVAYAVQYFMRPAGATPMQDIRFALRQLFKTPGFTAVAIITLALGIGACTAIFSVVNGVLLRPLTYQNPDQLVFIRETALPRYPEFSVSVPNYLDWEKQAQSFEGLAAYRSANYNLTGSGEPQRLGGMRVSAKYFPIYGIAPLLGRTFLAEEDTPAKGKVVVLSHRLWQRQFGGRPEVINETIQLNGDTFTIVGVMPATFQSSTKTELWAPMAFSDQERSNDNRGAHNMNVMGRLKANVSLAQAQSEMDVINKQMVEQYPDSNRGWGVRVFNLTDYTVRDVRGTLYTLLGAVGCVLLIACANIANLLLARASARSREISIRSAMGASRARIVRQLLTESVVLSVCGGMLGILVSKWSLDALLAFAPANLPRVSEIGLDSGALAFTLTLSVVTGLIFGVAPAWLATGQNLNETLKEGSRGSTEAGRRWFRQGLLVAEVALSLLLLTGAGLLTRSFMKLSGVNPGFNPSNATVVNVALPNRKYNAPEKTVQFANQLVAKLRDLPGVQSVGVTQSLPIIGDWVLGFAVQGRPPLPAEEEIDTVYYAVSADYFKAMGIRLVRGRYFTEQDNENSPKVAVINETLAKAVFPNEDPIGKRINVTNGEETWREIVGIVADVKQSGMDQETKNQTYEPFAQKPYGNISAVIRTTGDARAMYSSLRAQVLAVDRDQPVSSIRPLEEIVADAISRQRFASLLLVVFSGFALVIAAVGIYGVIAYSVSQRTSEIGIRMALGASQSDVLKMILNQALKVIFAGLCVGLVGALITASFIETMLYNTSARDPMVLAVIVVGLGFVGFVASLIPARRATKVDPMIALRNE